MAKASRSTALLGLTMVLVLGGREALLAQPAAKSATEKSYAQARQALDAAIKAMGGLEALQAVRDISRKGAGTAFNQGQSLKPDAPSTTRPVEVASVVDLAGKRSFAETTTTAAGMATAKARAVLNGDSGFGYNLVTNLVTPATAGGVTGGKTALRRDAAALLLTAASRAETLRFLGEEAVDGQKHNVITFADSDGAQIALCVSATTGLLTKYETLADNPVLGDTVTEVVFSDYRPVDRVKLPFRVVTKTASEVTQDLRYAEIRINTSPASSLFEAPRGAEQATPVPGAATVTVTKLADGVYLAGGSTHHSLFVVFADHVLLVEAPQSEDRSQAVMAKIKETAGDKPVKYVVVTHYHFDHSGGLRSYIAAGSTIVTTAGNKAFLERMAAAPHTIRPDALARSPRKPVIETLTGKRVFTDGTRTVEIHDVGPNPHVEEMLVAYLPKEKTLFVADLLTIPPQGPFPPAGTAVKEFAEKVKKLGLAVDQIIPAHGRPGSMEDLGKALASTAGPSK